MTRGQGPVKKQTLVTFNPDLSLGFPGIIPPSLISIFWCCLCTLFTKTLQQNQIVNTCFSLRIRLKWLSGTPINLKEWNTCGPRLISWVPLSSTKIIIKKSNVDQMVDHYVGPFPINAYTKWLDNGQSTTNVISILPWGTFDIWTNHDVCTKSNGNRSNMANTIVWLTGWCSKKPEEHPSPTKSLPNMWWIFQLASRKSKNFQRELLEADYSRTP